MTPFSLEEIMRVTRYHEAEHAVAAYHHGYLITGVTVSDEVCKTYFRRPVFDGWVDSWRETCVTMAGLLADQCAMWGEMRPALWAEVLAEAKAELEVAEDGEDWLRGDHSDLLQLLRQMSVEGMDMDLEGSYRMVVDDSRRFITDHWAEIEAVARALEQKSTLEGPEVILIIEQASRKEKRT